MAGPFYVDDGGGKAVTAATNANPCQVTIVGHGFTTGNKVVFHNVGGMTQLNFTNGSTGYTVTRVDDDTITIGVDSTAYGTYTSGGTAHNGLSWAASFLSLSALDDVFTFASNEIIYLGHDHVCQYAHTAARTFSAVTSGPPVILMSVTQGSDPPTYQKSSTNQVDTSEGAHNLAFGSGWALYGVCLKAGGNLTLTSSVSTLLTTLDVTTRLAPARELIPVTDGCSSRHRNLTIDCDADTSGTANNIVNGTTGTAWFEGLTILNADQRTGNVFGAGNMVRVSGADFSSILSSNEICALNFLTEVSNCLTDKAWTPVQIAGQSDGYAMFTNCGPENAPTYLYYADIRGTVVSTTNVYRSGGATVDGDALSWLIITQLSASENSPFVTPWIYGTVASSGSKTFDLYITNDTADFDNSQVWLEVEALGTANEAISTVFSDRRDNDTGAFISATEATDTQTDDTSSTWNEISGSGTYSQTATTVTVTDTAHGLIAGASVALDVTGTGGVTDGTYTVVTAPNADTFTVNASTGNGSGSLTWQMAPLYTYKQKLSVTATVNEPGLYRARVCVGVASIPSTRYFYVDPKVTVT
jgi:hypothetical protein